MNNATYSIVIVLSQLHNIMFPIKVFQLVNEYNYGHKKKNITQPPFFKCTEKIK